ncbi:hypothetical protein ACFE04_016449 [Oxalis oulophora]
MPVLTAPSIHLISPAGRKILYKYNHMEKSIFLFLRRFTLVLILFTSQIKGFQQSPTLSDSDDIGQQQQHHAKDIHCSRERSRLAWNNIEQYLMPYVETEKYEIPTKCRLHPDNDLFRDQEEHKICLDTNEWKCGYCMKAFRAEIFLDQHLHTRHYDLLNVSHSKCLADLCGALHCDYTTSSKKRKTKCNEATTAKNRHLCESLADNCFPIKKGPSASRLHEKSNFTVPFYCNTNDDAPPSFLFAGFHLSKRNEEGVSGAKANPTIWAQSKAIIDGIITSQSKLCETAFPMMSKKLILQMFKDDWRSWSRFNVLVRHKMYTGFGFQTAKNGLILF